MMTIEECLTIAQAHVRLAAFGTVLETQMIDAAIAQAAALTAQAMIETVRLNRETPSVPRRTQEEIAKLIFPEASAS